MRLTNSKRDSVICDEINKKFYKPLSESEKAIRDEIETLVKKTTPTWITDEMVSSGYIRTTSDFDIEGENWRYLSELELDGDALYQAYPIKGYGNHKIKKSKKLISLVKARKKVLKDEIEFSRDLRQVLAAYTTDKALMKVVPELKEHFADEIASMALVPLEQISRVRKAIKV